MITKNAWMPPTYFKVLLGLTLVFHGLFPIRTIIESPARYLGILPILLAVYLNLAASRAFAHAKTSIKPYETPTVFVTEGVFRRSRNPMYLGLVSFLLGWAWLLGTLTPFAAPVLMFVVLDRWFIPHEERALVAAFGQRFLTYRSKVRRWV